MTIQHQLPGVAELVAAFRTFRYSVFRLETLQIYGGSGEDAGIAALHRGDPNPRRIPPRMIWAAPLRANRDAGRIQQRVHVVVEPITSYLAYELTWEYGSHAVAGEDIRIIPVTGRWPQDVPQSDFTVFDSRALFRLRYAPGGTWLGAERISGPEAVVQACFVRDAALHQSMTWDEYLTGHPELLRRLPKDA